MHAQRRRLMASAASRALAFVPTALVVGVSLAGAAQAGTVNPNQNTTYVLKPTNNPITFGTGTNINAPAPAVYGAAGTDWNVTNQGKLTGTDGIVLFSGATVANSGSITSTAANGFGIVITTGAGTVTNDGSITALQSGAFGVVLTGGGSVTNNSDGVITSNRDGVVIQGGSGTVTNAGTITDNNTGVTGVAVVLENGGTVTNEAGGVLTGNTGVYNKAGAATVTNAGTITGRGDPAVALFDGGTINNQAGGVMTGGNTGIYAKGAATAITNAGTITGTTFDGISLVAGGSVDNQAGGKISGVAYGVFIIGGDGSVTNAGSITGNTAVELGAGGDVTNSGTLQSVGGNAVSLAKGGSVTNNTGGVITSNTKNGVAAYGGSASVTNAGTVRGASGVMLRGGGSVDNSGYILAGAGNGFGVFVEGGVGTITNSGAIASYDTAVVLAQGGSVTNNAGGTIDSVNSDGVLVTLGSGQVVNAGTIIASSTAPFSAAVVLENGGSVSNLAGGVLTGANGIGVYTQAPVTVTNAGTITGTIGDGVGLGAGGSVANQAGGKISGNYAGVYITGGDASVTNAGAITGVVAGVSLAGTNESVDNAGSIKATGTYGLGVALAGPGTVTNETGGDIEGTGIGVAILGDGSTLTNSGAIQGGYVGAALIGTGSKVTNNAGAKLSGGYAGLATFGAATITNAGTISATNAKYGIGVAALGGATVDNQAGGSISGGVVGLYVAGGATVTNAGAISGGTASIVFAGAGANTLTLETGSQLTGDVVGSTDAAATNALVLQGAGEADVDFFNFNTLAAQGTGTWVLGGTSTFGSAEVDSGMLVIDGALTAGGAVVDGGDLQVGDAAHGGATLTSAVTVNTGGVLSGHGTVVGNVDNNGGTVSPGGTIGTLTIVGNYTQSSAGALDIELTSAGSSRLLVSGVAHLDGALVFTPISGVFRKGQVFDFFDAGAITGSFSSITFDGPQIFAVSRLGNGFVATTTVGNFALAGGTLNQRAIVPAFNNIPVGVSNFDPLANAIIAMSPGAAQNQVVNELGSEISPDLVTATRNNVRTTLGDFTDKLGDRPGAGEGGAGEGGDADPVWLQGIGRFGSTSSDGNAHGFNDSAAGVAGGVQRDFGSLTAGGGVSWQQTWLSLSGLPQSGNVSDTSLGLYGEQRFGTLFADVGGLAGFQHGSVKRLIAAPGIAARQASGSFGGLSYGVIGRVGDRIGMAGGWTLEPRAGLAWSHVEQDAYTEADTGGAELAIGDEQQDAVQSLLGVRVAKALGTGFSGEASLDWAHEFENVTPRAAENFAAVPGTGFAIAGVNPGRDAALVRAGLNYKTSRITFFARYDGSFSNRANDNALTGGLKVAF